jgi:hypothetical protein
MKTYLFFAISILMGLKTEAQPAKNQFMIGGSVGFSFLTEKTRSGGTTITDVKKTNFTVAPLVGYFITDKTTLNIKIGYYNEVSKRPLIPMETVLSKSKFSAFVFGLFCKSYLMSEKGGIMMEYGFNLLSGEQEDQYSYGSSSVYTSKEKVSIFSAGISPGVYYSISPNIMIETKFGWFGYSSSNTKNDDDTKNTENAFEIKVAPSNMEFDLIIII